MITTYIGLLLTIPTVSTFLETTKQSDLFRDVYLEKIIYITGTLATAYALASKNYDMEYMNIDDHYFFLVILWPLIFLLIQKKFSTVPWISKRPIGINHNIHVVWKSTWDEISCIPKKRKWNITWDENHPFFLCCYYLLIYFSHHFLLTSKYIIHSYKKMRNISRHILHQKNNQKERSINKCYDNRIKYYSRNIVPGQFKKHRF